MSDTKQRTEFLIFEMYASIEKYLDSGPLSRFVVLDDIDFLLHRLALNKSKSIEEAASLLLVNKSQFISRLKKLGLYDCRLSELGLSQPTPVKTITLKMAQG